MKEQLVVEEESLLYDFLRKKLNGLSKNNVKNILKRKMVSVNEKIVTSYDYKIHKSDVITIKNNIIESDIIGDIKIIYEDKSIIVVDKPSGILTIATEKDKSSENNLYNIISKYVKKKNANNKIFIVHRLDKDTSGVILFAKNEKVKDMLQNKWNDIATRVYYAVVVGDTKEKETLKSYLKENSNLMTYVAKDGKLAVTHYRKIKFNGKYSLLEIKIDTGRRNQIRVQLSNINHPILGDNKYGIKDNSSKRLMLHAKSLDIVNKKTNEIMHFESDIPKSFYKVMDK